jgi:hypothetical protein
MVGVGCDPANAADVNPLAVPGHCPEENADVADERAVIGLDQHAQIRVRPFDMAPGKLLHLRRRPNCIQQLLGPWPGFVATDNFDFDAHGVRNAADGLR